ncbi:MAG: FeoB-associated Cys-rich membrane protein [Candidatus Marinimicrobia bacterium]|nr:FeoB-associated Cys-rich membrane protein [Candidatus Neomarinimicrobiota bacterium]
MLLQWIIVGIIIVAAATVLLIRFLKTIKKPQSVCDSCMMKDRCLTDFDFADNESDDFPCRE